MLWKVGRKDGERGCLDKEATFKVLNEAGHQKLWREREKRDLF